MRSFAVLALLFLSFSAFAQKTNSNIVIGTVDTITSGILGEKRVVYVHVPSSGDTSQRYPVLYLFDGEDHFLSAVAITEQLSGVLPPMIVVGITNNFREHDLTPTHVQPSSIVSADDARQSGGGEHFFDFIAQELIPYINSHYPAASYRILSGHSLGGLMVIDALFNHTDLFNAYIAIDPSLWWDNQNWIKPYESSLPARSFKNVSLFIAAANNIPANMDTTTVMKDTSDLTVLTRSVLQFVHNLRNGKPDGLRWGYQFYPDERHGTVELNAEYNALRYLFDYYSFSTRIFAGHPDWDVDSVLEAHYRLVSAKLGYKVLPSESMINNLAYSCLGQHNLGEAYNLFKRNTENHPKSSNAWDSLGDYYDAVGEKQNAINAYSRSLSLHETADTRRKLNQLKMVK